MVGPRSPDPAEGILSITAEGLSFAPLDGPGLLVPPGGLQRVRRMRASPALKVVYVEDSGPSEAFFFFAPPPPLPEAPRVPGLSMKGVQRTAGAMTLRAQSKVLRGEIDAWVAEISALGSRSPGPG
jgi:hypothetical protein